MAMVMTGIQHYGEAGAIAQTELLIIVDPPVPELLLEGDRTFV